MHAINLGAHGHLSRDEVVSLTTCSPNDNDFHTFLSKFHILDNILWTEELIYDKIKFIGAAIDVENIGGVFLDFSINKYSKIGWSIATSISFILDALKEHCQTPIIPILSIKYESSLEDQLKIADIVNHEVGSRICGIDFVGDELKYDQKFQSRICDMWAGRFIRLHVGEVCSHHNIDSAIENKNVTNIAHGIKIINNEQIVKKAIDSGIVFDLAPSGNYKTGILNKNNKHPVLEMLKAGIQLITVGSDDPTVMCSTIHDEYELLKNQGMVDNDIELLLNNGQMLFNKHSQYVVQGHQ